jgi:hypothetical protein
MRTAGILSHRTNKIKCYDRLNPPDSVETIEAHGGLLDFAMVTDLLLARRT